MFAIIHTIPFPFRSKKLRLNDKHTLIFHHFGRHMDSTTGYRSVSGQKTWQMKFKVENVRNQKADHHLNKKQLQVSNK